MTAVAESAPTLRTGALLGEGMFSICSVGACPSSGRPLALKVPREYREHSVVNEAAVLKSLSEHKNVAKFAWFCEKTCTLATELATGGELFDYVGVVGQFADDISRVLLRQMASALRFVHDAGYAHLDVKPENFVVCASSWLIKLIDFGSSARIGSNGKVSRWTAGSPGFLAPELADRDFFVESLAAEQRRAKNAATTASASSQQDATTTEAPREFKADFTSLCSLDESFDGCAADTWSMGVSLFVLACGFPPWVRAARSCSYYRRYVTDKASFWSWVSKRRGKEIDSDLIHILESLMSLNPAARLRPAQVEEHAFTKRSPAGAFTAYCNDMRSRFEKVQAARQA